ncbi:putative cytochrome P450 hydroxylase [Cystobacter fuscus DSM 2262]|uniref:Cytochrome P450 hydroxylase n=1 Tax=Cystobacter fuscus (strain ATCC 25194 / DSM 2262 / NBRC 100088 / M29) TaxID=1242864 RepID=S9PNV1_CYSF2|nr:cytochrome P450 [Cystobacter fuscus]EPX64112.1 putative cytochrome P450 hydroxylase [Cystobacter fuscus DSM 2262]
MHQRLNLMSPEIRANPYPAYAEFRRTTPVAQVDPGGLWAVSRYEDVLHIFKNPKLYSSEGLRLAADPPWFGRSNPISDSLIFMDDPKVHGRMRGLVNRAFGPSALSRLEPSIRATAEQLTTRVLDRRDVDFVADFALPLPASVIGALLGLDPALHSRFKQWADDIMAISATQPGDTAMLEQCRRTVAEMEQYLGQVLEHRRQTPGDDMVSDLLRSRVDGEALTAKELLGFLFLLLIAGLETTVHLLGHSARILAEHPAVLRQLRGDRSLIPRFIEEVLRFEPPVHGTIRLCTQDVTLAGVSLPRGSPLLVLQGSALRDEHYCADADRFSLERKGPQNLAFGHGMHFCLGAALARVEARVALEALLARCGTVSLRPEPVEWNFAMTVRGMRNLPLEVLPA